MKIWFPSKTVWKPDLGVPEKEAEQLVSFIAVVAECGSMARSFNRRRNGHNGKTSKEDLLQKTTVA